MTGEGLSAIISRFFPVHLHLGFWTRDHRHRGIVPLPLSRANPSIRIPRCVKLACSGLAVPLPAFEWVFRRLSDSVPSQGPSMDLEIGRVGQSGDPSLLFFLQANPHLVAGRLWGGCAKKIQVFHPLLFPSCEPCRQIRAPLKNVVCLLCHDGTSHDSGRDEESWL